MSTSPPGATIPNSSQHVGSGSASSIKSDSDWLATSLLTARAVTAAAECIPFPYVKGVFGTFVIILETVEKLKRNRDDLKELCQDTVEIITIVRNEIVYHGTTAAVRFKEQCEQLESVLQDVLNTVKQLQTQPQGFRAHVKELIKLSSIADQITGYRNRIQTLRSNFVLLASIEINFKVDKIHEVLSNAILPRVPTAQVVRSTTDCPPPSRMFHGRQLILDEMHSYFTQISEEQQIFLLYGLGGAGKTQIALKFIQESSAHFSNIFLIDTSKTETINAGLSNIAITRRVGDSPQEGLQWLSTTHTEWLLFFDNADNPNINLNEFFPKCTHGNILITSRNPGLRVHAGSNQLISDMEAADAVELLLKGAQQDMTSMNKEIAAEIVKVLCYLPLAIIQAAAFIAKSDDLDSYLEFYAQNQARLLNEKPAQSHDDYALTVYTTWQISFDQLSDTAKEFLRLCSLLHHNMISEKMFSNASTYKCNPYGPSQDELDRPREFLSHFLKSTGVWDSLCFRDITNEIRGYSLLNFDQGKKLFSIHPLVHAWCRSRLLDQESYLYCMVAIVGMSFRGIPDAEKTLASVQWLPHIQALLHGDTNLKPDFREEYGNAYHHAGIPKEAVKLRILVLEQRRQVLGEEHPDTLVAMKDLAVTYYNLDHLKEAEELNTLVLAKRTQLIGKDHPETLHIMNNLGLIYSLLGQLKKAEEFTELVFAGLRKHLGEDHLDTLRAMSNLAVLNYQLGRLDKAKELALVVLEKKRKVLGKENLEVLNAMVHLANIYRLLDQLKDAEELEVSVLSSRKTLLGEEHPDTLSAMNNLSLTYSRLGRMEEAKEIAVVVLEKRMKWFGEDHLAVLASMTTLANIQRLLGQLAEAEKLQVLVLAKQIKRHGPEHPDALSVMQNLSMTYYRLGRIKEARELAVVVVERRAKFMGEEHPDLLESMHTLANIHHLLGQSKEAENLQVLVLTRRRKVLGEEHTDTVNVMSNLALTYTNLGRFTEAEELGAVVLEKRRKLMGEGHPHTLIAMQNLAITYAELGRLREAETLQVVVVEKYRNTLGVDHPDLLAAMNLLANIYNLLGQGKNAEELQMVVLEKHRKFLGDKHPKTLTSMQSLGNTFSGLGKFKEAEHLQSLVLEQQRKLLGEDHPGTLKAMNNLAWTYSSMGRLKEAEILQVVVLEKYRNIGGNDHPHLPTVMDTLATIYRLLGKLKEAEELGLVVLEKRKQVLGEENPETLDAMNNLALIYTELGRLKEAEDLQLLILEKRKNLLGEKHPHTLDAINNLALTSKKLEESQKQA